MLKNTCRICGHVWTARTERPIKCPNPKCQSPDWDDQTLPLPIHNKQVESKTDKKGVVILD